MTATGQHIGILGCGWLGTPLAQRLLALGHMVSGTTTRAAKLPLLQVLGIQARELRLTGQGVEGDTDWLRDLDALVLNVPPGLRRGGKAEDFLQRLRPLLAELEALRLPRLLFVSSTSVFGDAQGEVDEQSPCHPEKESGKALVEAERLVRAGLWRSSILRFGGLLGPDRHPVRYLAGRQNLPNGDAPVNLIHLDDCIGLIEAILDLGAWGQTFHGVADQHPARRDYYQAAARRLGMAEPGFLPGNAGSLVRNFATHSQLSYSFRYPDPYDMIPAQLPE